MLVRSGLHLSVRTRLIVLGANGLCSCLQSHRNDLNSLWQTYSIPITIPATLWHLLLVSYTLMNTQKAIRCPNNLNCSFFEFWYNIFLIMAQCLPLQQKVLLQWSLLLKSGFQQSLMFTVNDKQCLLSNCNLSNLPAVSANVQMPKVQPATAALYLVRRRMSNLTTLD